MAPRRIVSLVPSLTEILFTLGVGDAVAGCTIFCTQPPEGVAGTTRVGGEKNPNLELIRELGADLVLAWPSAEIGVLGAKQAVGIVHRRAIEDAGDPEDDGDREPDSQSQTSAETAHRVEPGTA